MERRLKLLRITGSFLADRFRGEHNYCILNPLPEDAKLLGIIFNPWGEYAELLFFSSEYPIITEGCIPLTMDPIEIEKRVKA